MFKIVQPMHSIAARRGDGLLPELAALLERLECHSTVTADSEVLTKQCSNVNSHAQNSDTTKQHKLAIKLGS